MTLPTPRRATSPPTAADPSPPLVYIHIPKTGGLSMQHALAEALGPGSVHRDNGFCRRTNSDLVQRSVYDGRPRMTAEQAREANRELLDGGVRLLPEEGSPAGRRELVAELASRGTQTVYMGHFRFRQVASAQGEALFATMVRDPVERVLSEFHFYKREGYIEGTLSEYLDGFGERHEVQSAYLEGADLEQFDFIGVCDRYSESLDLLGSILDIELEMEHRNASPRAGDVPPEIRARIERLVGADRDVFEAGRALFERRLRAAVSA